MSNVTERIHLKKLTDNIYLMNDNGESTGYIVLGGEKAAVIDTMNGYENVRDVVRTVTALPLIVINTHGHCDHVYGNIYFDKVYIHPADLPVLREHTAYPDFAQLCGRYGPSAIQQAALLFAEKCGKLGMHMPELLPINDGDIIDLGRRKLEVISLPGHTPGSICLLSEEDRVLFTGDGINRHLWAQLDESSDLQTIAANLDKIAYVKDKADYILHGHAADFEPITLFDELRSGIQDILDGNTADDKPYLWFGGEAVVHYYGNGSAVVYKRT